MSDVFPQQSHWTLSSSSSPIPPSAKALRGTEQGEPAPMPALKPYPKRSSGAQKKYILEVRENCICVEIGSSGV